MKVGLQCWSTQVPQLNPPVNKEYNMVGAPEHEAVETWGGVAGGARKQVPSFPGNCFPGNGVVKNKSLGWHSQTILAKSPQNENLTSYSPFSEYSKLILATKSYLTS